MLAHVGDSRDSRVDIRGGHDEKIMIWLIIIGAVVLLLALNVEPAIGGEMSFDVNAIIRRYARETGVDSVLIYGVVMAESGGDSNARNLSDPSAGLMQVTPIIGRYYGGLSGNDSDVLSALLNPDINVQVGTRFLAHLQARYAGAMPISTWIQAYNLGETQFDAGRRAPAYAERVLRYMAQAPESLVT